MTQSRTAQAQSATFVGVDSTTQGTWKGNYGNQGYSIVNDTTSLPSYASISASGNSAYVWADPSTDVRALQHASSSNRVAACWYSYSTFTVDINLTDSNTHQLSLYCLDWETTTRQQKMEVLNGSTGAVMDTQTLNNYHNGRYVIWNVQGHVQIRFTTLYPNAVVSGIFLDPVTSHPSLGAAKFIGTDTSTQGTWKGKYGNQGYSIVNDATSLPSYASVNPIENSIYVWAASTTDVRALQKAASTTDRVAACYYQNSYFLIDVNLTDANWHQISLYCLDWETTTRQQSVEILDAGNENVLNTQTLSGYHNGKYLIWNIKGHVKIRCTTLYPNAVVSGIFLDPPVVNFPEVPAWAEDVIPTDSFSIGGFGPSVADAVNLATGEEENLPGPDMVVRNPVGPSPGYTRMYRSARAFQGYASPGLSPGWVDNYDLTLQAITPGTWGGLRLTYPNGGSDTLSPARDGSGNPTGAFGVPSGTPYLVTGVPAQNPGQWQSVTITFKDQSTITFAPDANNPDHYLLSRMTNPIGHSITLNRDAANGSRLTSITNDAVPQLALLSFTYQGAYLSTLTDVYGRQVQFSFGPAAGTTCLTSVSQIGSGVQFQTQWQYGYTAFGGGPLLSSVGVPDPSGSGNISTHPILYDGSGRVSSLIDANGNQRAYAYNGGSTQVLVTDPNGNSVETWGQNLGNLGTDIGSTDANNQTDSAAYDPILQYYPISVTNKNNQTATAAYDNAGNLLTVMGPLRLDQNASLITSFLYDYSQFSLGRVSEVATTGKLSTLYTYYPNGLVQTIQSPDPSGMSLRVTTTYTYTQLGNIATVTVPAPNNQLGATVTYTYNYTFDPLGNVIRTEALGEPLTVTDPMGNMTHFRYDAYGNLTSVIDALGNETDYVYNIADQCVQVIYPATGQTGPGRSYTLTTYRYPGGSAQSTALYDESGNLVRQVNQTSGKEDETLGVSGSVHPTNFGFDAQYRTTQLSDGNHNATQYQYDNVGNLQKQSYPGATGTTPYDIVQGTFDPNHNLKQRTDGRSLLTQYTYATDDDRLLQVDYQDGTHRQVTYDLQGRVTYLMDSAGSYTYTYNDLDQVVSYTVSYNSPLPQITIPPQTISYTYYPDGHRASMTAVTGTYTYQYDLDGRLTDVSNPWQNGSYHYNYDANSRLIEQQQYHFDTFYTYDAADQLTSLSNYSWYFPYYTNAPIPYLHSSFTNIQYDAAGNRTSMQTAYPLPFQSGQDGKVTYTYDNRNRLTRATSNTNLVDINDGTTSSTPGGGYDLSFSYDTADNITGITGSYSFVGNTNPVNIQPTYNADNQITSGTNGYVPSSFQYDGDGNPTTFAGMSLAFDGEDQLTSFTVPSGAGNHVYGFNYRSDGLRAWQDVPTQTGQPFPPQRVYYYYDGDRLLFEVTLDTLDTNDLTEVTAAYGWGANGLVQSYYYGEYLGTTTQQATFSRYAASFTTHSYVFDPSGNTVSVMDDMLEQQLYQFRPFGDYWGWYIAGSDGSLADVPVVSPNIGFSGQWGCYTDEEGYNIGLVLMGHRYYSTVFGRFLTRDPIDYDGGINLYAYTENNPVNRVDPSGLDFKDWIIGTFKGLWNSNADSHPLVGFIRIFAGSDFLRVKDSNGDEWSAMHDMEGFMVFYGAIAPEPVFPSGEVQGAFDFGPEFAPQSSPKKVPNPNGCLGDPSTRAQDAQIAAILEKWGWKVTHGPAGVKPQEWMKPEGGEQTGSARPDLTAIKTVNGDTYKARVNTVTMNKNGTPTTKELPGIKNIKALQKPGEFLAIVKKKNK
ncbi:MAG TPA: RHS repeat-associated core domain-containing protein [Chthonomonadaceae bacterium]|nr:RHS repeat-associated core domain-containing protein [Chthonomonadaceae bacterium]